MGRHSACCVKQKLRKGLWSPEEDEKLLKYITRFGVGCWSSVPKHAGLQRCGKSCRLRWINYLRPDLKRGLFSQQEEDIILNLHQVLGNRWAQIAAQLPGRTDNEIKNFWNSCLKKKLMKQGIDPNTHMPVKDKKIELFASSSMPMAAELDHHAFHFNNIGGLILSSSVEASLIRDTFGSKSICDPLFFQSGVDPIGYNSNLLAQFHETNYEATSLPNLASFDNPNGYFSDHSSSKVTANSSSTTNSCSNMNTSLSAGFQPMKFEGEMLDQFNVKSEAKSTVGQWAQNEVQVNNASGFNISLPGEYHTPSCLP